MHKLHRLLKQIYKELEAAEEYMHCAGNSEADVRDTYKMIAREELTHAERLIAMCNRHIENDMKQIWEFEKENIIERLMHDKTKMAHID